MKNIQIIDRRLLDQVSGQADASPRRRKNHNFHAAESDACHRLLNAVEADSYIPPHCHHDAGKDETLIVVRGRIGVVFFDERGSVTSKALLVPGGDVAGVNIPHGVYHTLVALEPDSVFFEAKAGPYTPLTPREKASWAPAEGEPRASSYLAELKRLFV
ncbi:MAG: WbuC family cupin fold metalloprotein [Gammaproteobacteria bacterium]|nr:WbuC family cupin fold metalloprotein [Gammaproteobacteria bacterium]